MLKKSKQNRVEKIIDAFFRDRYGEEFRNRMHERFVEWLSNPKDDKLKDREMRKVWDEIWAEEPQGISEVAKQHLRELERTSDETKTVRSRRRGRLGLAQRVGRVAAVFVALLMIGGGVWFFSSDVKEYYADFATESGEVLDQRLADSSQIWINSASSLTVVQSKRERAVELKGEGYFKVAKDEKRPFVVKTEYLTIEVLGTEFNVMAYLDSELTVVTLDSGRIDVKTAEEERYTLEPNQQLTFSRTTGEVSVKEYIKAREASAWKQGLLVFDGVPLKEVLRTIERSYGVNITLTGDTDLNQLLIGKFEIDMGVEELINRISLGVPNLKYKISNQEIE